MTKVLVVDDHPSPRAIVAQRLRNLGHTVLEGTDGERALVLLKHCVEEGKPIEFVVTDGSMPSVDGIALIRKMRAEPAFAMIPIVFMSGDVEHFKALATEAGAERVFDKLTELTALIKYVSERVGGVG